MKSCILSCLLLALFAGAIGCRTSAELRSHHGQYDAYCERMAENYRLGRYERVWFEDMTGYFERRIGTMTSADLRLLLGEPRVVTPEDDYYGDALAEIYPDVYGLDAPWDPTRPDPDDKHDHVLHYGENGPPTHWIGDESQNLFFVIKDDIVIGMWGLFP